MFTSELLNNRVSVSFNGVKSISLTSFRISKNNEWVLYKIIFTCLLGGSRVSLLLPFVTSDVSPCIVAYLYSWDTSNLVLDDSTLIE